MKNLRTEIKIFLCIMICILIFTSGTTLYGILYPLYMLGLLFLMFFGLLEWGLDNIFGNYQIVNWLSGDFPGIELKGLFGWLAVIIFYLIISYLLALLFKKIKHK